MINKRTEREITEGLHFVSIQAALDYMTRMLVPMQTTLALMESDPHVDPQLLAATRGAVDMLSHPEKLRARLDRIQQPDGSVRFTFSPGAQQALLSLGHALHPDP